MLSLALTLALSGLPVFPQLTGPEAPPSVLHAAPADALFLAYSPDLGAVREAARECPWVRYFTAGPGREYLELGVELLKEEHPRAERALPLLRPLAGLCSALDGEALVFATEKGLGVVLETGERQESADQAITSFLENLPVVWTITMVGYRETTLQLWQPGEREFFLGRAMGGGLTALFFGESAEPVLAALREGVDDHRAGELTVDARRIAARLRGGVPRVVVTADLQRVAGLLSEGQGARAREGRKVVQALGLDRETWILMDLHRSPGGAIHEVVKVAFQPETGLARLADSFRPLQMNDLAGLPAEAEIFSVARWDVRGFVETALDLAGPQARRTWSNAARAGESATGVHFHRDLIDQLTGRFAVYRAGEPGQERLLLDPLEGSTLSIGVRDGEAFADTLLDLVEATGSEGMVEIDDVHGLDVWSFEVPGAPASGGPALPRLVFTPEAVLVVSAAQDLEQVLAPFAGGRRPSLADRSVPVEALRSHAGAFFLGYQDLAAVAATITWQLHGAATLLGLEVADPPDRAALKSWFPGRAVSAWERTAEGLELRATLR